VYERGEVQRRIEPNYGVNPMLGAHIGLELAEKGISFLSSLTQVERQLATVSRHPT